MSKPRISITGSSLLRLILATERLLDALDKPEPQAVIDSRKAEARAAINTIRTRESLR